MEKIMEEMDKVNKKIKWVNWILKILNGYDSKGNSVLKKELET